MLYTIGKLKSLATFFNYFYFAAVRMRSIIRLGNLPKGGAPLNFLTFMIGNETPCHSEQNKKRTVLIQPFLSLGGPF